MASTMLKKTKSGKAYYRISVSRGHGVTPFTTNWYVPEGLSASSVKRALAGAVREFETKCLNGEVLTREEKKAVALEKAEAEAKISTVEQYSERVFMRNIRSTGSKQTVDGYERCLTRWIYPRIGSTRINEVTPAQIKEILLSMQNDGYAYTSVIKAYAIMNTLFKSAYLDETKDRNIMDRVPRPKQPKSEGKDKKVEAFTEDEVRYILECLENEPLQREVFFRLLIDTGIRKGEACGLMWRNVDFENDTITVKDGLNYTPEAGVYMDTTKNGKARVIYVDPQLMVMLKELRAEQASVCVSPYVFSQTAKPDPIHPCTPSIWASDISEKYGIEKFHCHKLRHTFASVAITNGADISSVSEILGHHDPAFTLRQYTHSNDEAKRRASNVFREALKSKQA